MKVALIIGHKLTSGGAVSPNGVDEFDYNEELAGMIACNLSDEPGIEVLIFHRKKYLELPGEINAKNPDIVISLHCNAYNTKVSGSEVLYYYKSVKGKVLAQKMLDAIKQALNIKDRGIKGKSTEDRGGVILRYTDAPCVLLEPFFIDNPFDWNIGRAMKLNLALSLSDAIMEYCNG